MSDTVIRVENLGKRYRIGLKEKTPKTLRQAITGVVGSPFKYLRTVLREPTPEEVIWALKDVSFEVKQGEVVGIIGRNGAGKSTLLKILSQITEPTCGFAEIRGRVGSLLEVGTGFHPDLTGRENTYLNGTILGMTKREIDRHFNEIVAFAEVEKFIDTPVKFYSSGMYTRLAFAVAAHLQPEILIVDEVLAVGDAAFQKKCLGKMGDVATKEGRTVLFVSHNMQAVSQLTNRCVLLANGKCKFDGSTDHAVNAYNAMQMSHQSGAAYYEAPLGILHNHVAWARVHTSEKNGLHRWGQSIAFEFALRIMKPKSTLCFAFQIFNNLQQPICHFWNLDSQAPYRNSSGTFYLRCEVPKFRLYMGSYTLTTWLTERRSDTLLESISSICPFEVTMQGVHRQEYEWAPGSCIYIEDAVWTAIYQGT